MPASLRVVTPVADPVVSLAEAKGWLRVDHDADNALIQKLVASAAADCGAECGRGFGVATYAVTFDAFPCGTALVPGPGGLLDRWAGVALPLPVRPVVSVDAVRYRDAGGTLVTMNLAGYWPAPQTGRVLPASGEWPATQPGRPEAVEVQFTAGHPPGSVPPQAWQAILLTLADRYENRGDEQDQLGGPDVGGRRALPKAASRLLWQLHDGTVF